MKKVLVLDIETTGLNPRTESIHGIGISNGESTEYYSALNPPTPLLERLADPETELVGHNIRFDLKFLIQKGFKINARFWDTKILAQLVNENQELGLKPLSEKYFGGGALQNKSELDRAVTNEGLKHVGELCRLDLEDSSAPYFDLIAEYCKEDCDNTFRLWELLIAELSNIHTRMLAAGYKTTARDYFIEEAMPTEKVLLHMELYGVRINESGLRDYRDTLIQANAGFMKTLKGLSQQQIAAVEDDLTRIQRSKRKSEKGKALIVPGSEKLGTQFNWNSSDHLSRLLFDKLRIPLENIPRTKTGKPSTAEESLSVVANTLSKDSPQFQIMDTFAKFKKVQKLLSTYTGEDKGLLSQVEDGRVYAEYLQAGRGKEGTKGGTVTGRLSSRNPNMQNLPRESEIKSFFIPDEGNLFLYFDYSQLELRLAAHLSEDPTLIAAFTEGLDLHQLTADDLGIERQQGKTINFAMIYNASPYRLLQELGSPHTFTDCQRYKDGFFERFNIYKKYLDDQRRNMTRSGYVVSTFGRVRRLPDLIKPNTSWKDKDFKHAINQGYNFPIQSFGASITKRAMVQLHNEGYRLVTQVHDSVIIEISKGKALNAIKDVKAIAESICPLSVPLKADVKILTSFSESDTLENVEEIHEKPIANSRN